MNKFYLRFFSRQRLTQNSVVFWNAVLTALFIIILLLLILFKIKPDSGNTPLHYNVLVGIDVVESGWHTLALPGLALVFAIVNFYLARKFFRFEPVASYFLVIASTILAGIFLIAGITLSRLF